MDRSPSMSDKDGQENSEAMNSLIMSELLGYSRKTVAARHSEGSSVITTPPSVLSYQQKTSPSVDSNQRINFPLRGLSSSISAPHRQSEPIKMTRKIKRLPYKVLDAPALQDDFYLNLVDWSYRNTLAVGLGASVYLWAASTAKIQQLCNLGETDAVSSVAWLYEGTHLAVGTNLGKTLIYDVTTKKMLTELAPHAARVGSLAWCGFSSSSAVGCYGAPASTHTDQSGSSQSAFINNNNNPVGTGSCSGLLASGSRDKHIFLHDPRIRSFYKSSSDPINFMTPRPDSIGSASTTPGSGSTILASQIRQQARGAPQFPSLHLPEEDFDMDSLFPMAGGRVAFMPRHRSLSTAFDDDMDIEMSPAIPPTAVSLDPGMDPMIMSVDDFAEDIMESKLPSFPGRSSPVDSTDAWESLNIFEDRELNFFGGRHSAPDDRTKRSAADSPFSTPSRSSYPSSSGRKRESYRSTFARYPSFTPPRAVATPISRHSSPTASPSWAAPGRPGLASPAGIRAGTSNAAIAPTNTTPPSPPPTVPQQPGVVSVLSQHRQEVCGLKWSFDGCYLASGGNDNKLCVWSPMHSSGSRPVHHFADHTAAVKAIAWSPHQQHILASGGGTADRHIRFWNTTTGQSLQKIDTGSQVFTVLIAERSLDQTIQLVHLLRFAI